jgi:hypothetical protein
MIMAAEFFTTHRPIVHYIAFYQASFDSVVDAYEEWRLIGGPVSKEEMKGPFEDSLQAMYPLNEGKSLFVECNGGWVAHFVDREDYPKYWPIIDRVQCRAVIAGYRPDTYVKETDEGELGGVQLSLYKKDAQNSLDFRAIYCVNEGDRWIFDASGGTPWRFEETEPYKARRIRDRFTYDMLVRYLRALKIDAYSPEFYRPRSMLYRRIRDEAGNWGWETLSEDFKRTLKQQRHVK